MGWSSDHTRLYDKAGGEMVLLALQKIKKPEFRVVKHKDGKTSGWYVASGNTPLVPGETKVTDITKCFLVRINSQSDIKIEMSRYRYAYQNEGKFAHRNRPFYIEQMGNSKKSSKTVDKA